MTGRVFDTSERFGATTKFFHWVTLLLVAALFPLGWYMVGLPLEPETFEIYALHKSLGLTVLGLTVFRLIWRLFNPTPPVLGEVSAWQRGAARISHGLLYAILITLPMSGWLLSSAADFLPSWFGLFELPALVEPDDGLREKSIVLHQMLGWLFLALLVLHVGAAIHHHAVRKDATLRRMLPGDQAQSSVMRNRA